MRAQQLLSPAFRNGSIPRFLYITRQEHGISRPFHTHESICELSLVIRGSGSFRLNDDLYPLQTGDLVINNAGEEHEMLSDNDTLEAYCLGFTEVCLRNYPDNYLSAPKTPAVRHSGRKFHFLIELADQILDLDPGNNHQQMLLQSLALSFLLTADSIPFQNASPVITDNASNITAEIKNYISAHFTEDIRLDDIAEALSFSPDYISHIFKKATGYSVMEYVIRRRIGYAETLLISSDFPITHIATLVGYSNPNHFQTSFKKISGVPPLQYRNRYLKLLHGERNQQ